MSRTRTLAPGPAWSTPPPLEDRLIVRSVDGSELPLNPSRWHGPTSSVDHALLDQLDGPVLDVGCGPGRIVERLVRRGVVALGVDPAPGAVRLARRRGCPVLQRSVFDPLPGEGRWRNLLLFDGNLGIGGDPVRLLRRCLALVHGSGEVVAEVQPPGSGWRTCRARLERSGERSAWFAWSIVDADAITALAAEAGFDVRNLRHPGDDRWFARLTPRAQPR